MFCVSIYVLPSFFLSFSSVTREGNQIFFLCLLHCDTSVHKYHFCSSQTQPAVLIVLKTVQFYLHKCGPACVCVFERKENIFCEMHSFIFGTVYQPGLFPRRKKQSDLKRFVLKLPT